MRNTLKKVMVSVLAVALLLGVAAVPSQDAQAKGKKVSMTKKIKVEAGKRAKINLKNNKKNVKWKITKGKNLIKITRKSKTSATVKGLKKGTAKVQAVVGKKKYSCTVTVSEEKKQAETDQPQDAGTPVSTLTPSVGTPATSVPTSTPSGTAMPSSTVDPDTVPTIVLDSGEWESEGYRRMQEMEKKGEYYKVNITCTYYTDHEWVTDDVIVSGNKIPNCDGCIHMIAVTLPDNVDIIGVDTFAGCENLTSIEIPEGVTTIGDQAFLGCSKLSDIKLPSTLLNIATEAFRMCKSLTSIEIPESVTTIGNQAFGGCDSLTEIEIPAGVTNIGGGLFGFPMCEKLTTITVAEENPVYDSRNGCNAIIRTADNALVSTCNTTILPEGLKKIGAAAFKDGDMISYTIPEGITTIEDQAFRNCRNLTSITIPDSVTSIGSDVFANCSSLPEITIPDGVTSIGEGAFAGCSSLTSITIPDSVTSIGDGAFFFCRNLTSIAWKGTVYTSGESFEAAFRR